MCNCNNGYFQVNNGELYGEYDGDFHKIDKEDYSFCPICGDNLQPERLNPETLEKCPHGWSRCGCAACDTYDALKRDAIV